MKPVEIQSQVNEVYGKTLWAMEWYEDALELLEMAAQMFMMKNEMELHDFVIIC